MSSTFDSMSRLFHDRFEPKSGDETEKHFFSMIIEEIHSYSHSVGDALNRSNISKPVRRMEKYINEKEV